MQTVQMSQIPPPPGELIDIGGHRLHIYRMGSGSPTVVFEAGGASWSLDWYLVQTEVAKFAGTCSYDRAGFGWSDLGPMPRTIEKITDELHTLLEKAGIPRPYLLVGASFGGHVARLFAQQYPNEVAGIVLLDARHEAIDQRMPTVWRQFKSAGKGMYKFLWLASQLGALKFLAKMMGEKAAPPIVQRLPPEIRPMYLEVGFQPKYFKSNLDELAASSESDQQVMAAGSLGSLPLTVIRHGIPDLFVRMPVEQARQAERIWQELQMELTHLSSNSNVLVAEKSGHAIQIDQPDLVIEVIRQILVKARDRHAG